jgi:hypothetical protein
MLARAWALAHADSREGMAVVVRQADGKNHYF